MYATPGRTLRIWGDRIDDEITHIIVNQMEALNGENPEDWITLEIFSSGGDMLAGRALYSWLRLNVKNLQTVAYSVVNSMAVVLYLAGRHRIVTPDCSFLLHSPAAYHNEPSAFTRADYLAEAKSLKEIERAYVDVLLERMEKSPSRADLRKILEDETQVKPSQALKWGLAHELWRP